MLNDEGNIRELTRQIPSIYIRQIHTAIISEYIILSTVTALSLSLSLSLTLFSRFPSHHAVITRLSVSSIIIVVKNHSKPRLTRILFSSFFFFSFIFLFSFPLLQLSSQLSLLLLIVERATAAPYIFTFESIVDRFQVSDVIRFTQKIRFKLVETDKLWI